MTTKKQKSTGEARIKYRELSTLAGTKGLYRQLESRIIEHWREKEITALAFYRDVYLPYLERQIQLTKEGMNGSRKKAQVWEAVTAAVKKAVQQAEAGKEEILEGINLVARHCDREADRFHKQAKSGAGREVVEAYDVLEKHLRGTLDLFRFIV